jgi:acetyl esterase/lipase
MLRTAKNTHPLVAGVVAAVLAPCCVARDNPYARTTPVAAGEPIPIFDFFRPPLLASPEINRGGTHAAAIATLDDDRQVLLIHDLITRKVESVQGNSYSDIYDFAWLDDSRILFAVSEDNAYATGRYVADVRNTRKTYPIEYRNATRLLGVPRNEPLKPVVWIFKDYLNDGVDAGVFQLDALKTLDLVKDADEFRVGTYEALSHGTHASVARSYPKPAGGMPVGYFTDKDGELAFAYTAKEGVITLHYLEGRKWTSSPLDMEEVDVVAAGNKPRELLVLGPRREGRPRALHLVDAATTDLGSPVFEDDRYSFDGWVYRHPVDGTILGLKFHRTLQKTVWLTESYQKFQEVLQGYFPNLIVSILASDVAEKIFFLAVYSDRHPVSYYQVDLEKRERGLIAASRPWIDAERMRTSRVVTFKTRDGLKLEGYLTTPEGTSKEKPAPLVVLPHGGPWARDIWSWDGEVQFLASRGYAVWQPNYRGSEGYEWMSPENDLWEFRKMHGDVTDSVQRLIRSGLIDPDRIAIMGWSFGGYLALSGVAFETDLYRCALPLAGVFDWELLMRQSKRDQFENTRFQTLLRRLGDPRRNAAHLEEMSPARHLDRVKVPVFIAHGKIDRTAPLEQSTLVANGLRARGVTVVTHFESEEGHGVASAQNRVELYDMIEKFLAENLAPRTKPTAAPAATP